MTLKLIHTSDLHLGTYFHGMSHSKQLARINDFFKNFEEIVEFAIKERCDFFLIVGDVFSNPLPRGEIFNRFSRQIGRLVNANIKVLVVAGNHDTSPNLAQRNTALGLNLAGVKNFIYIDYKTRFKPFVLEGYYSKRRVAFLSIPFIYPEVFQIEGSPIDFEKKIYQIFDKQICEEKNVDYRIGLAHLTIEGAKYGEKVEPLFTYELKLSKSVLNHMFRVGDLDYFALGHIHLHQSLDRKGVMRYSGSIEKINFGEAGEEKGFVFIKEDGGRLKPEFVKLNTRRMITLEGGGYDLTKPWNNLDVILNRIREMSELRDSLVRLVIKYFPDQLQSIDWRRIHAVFNKMGVFYVKVVKLVEKRKTIESREGVEGKSVEKSLEEYIKEILRAESPELIERVLKWVRRLTTNNK